MSNTKIDTEPSVIAELIKNSLVGGRITVKTMREATDAIHGQHITQLTKRIQERLLHTTKEDLIQRSVCIQIPISRKSPTFDTLCKIVKDDWGFNITGFKEHPTISYQEQAVYCTGLTISW